MLVSGLASIVLALSLYFIQRKLYAPLQKLREATKAISQGDFSARADDSGNDEFAELAEDFNAMSDKINQQMDELRTTAQQKQTMLDNLGHEMRTPLTSIYGAAEYSFRHELTEEARMQTLLDIMSESKRLQRISKILLDSAFIRENGIQTGKLSAGGLMARIRDIFILRASEKNIKLAFAGENFELEGDVTLLEMLIANLTENAVRAAKEGGEVFLGTEIKDGVKTLYVRDNGSGMTKEQIEHITEPFYRTDKARSRTEGGTGLGLALCKRIADAHGAELVFESEVGVGTTAYVRFL
jgi:signal transduction histidine kinase